MGTNELFSNVRPVCRLNNKIKLNAADSTSPNEMI